LQAAKLIALHTQLAERSQHTEASYAGDVVTAYI
jgi:hypothetical protein